MQIKSSLVDEHSGANKSLVISVAVIAKIENFTFIQPDHCYLPITGNSFKRYEKGAKKSHGGE